MTWKLYQLQDNFRCCSEVCRIANALMAAQPDRLPKLTVSATGQPGEVVVKADGFETDDQEAHEVAEDIMRWLAVNYAQPASSCAVLVRTNASADFFRDVLKAHGLPVCEPKRADLPADWARAKAALAMLTNPDNDRTAYVAIRLASGRDKADEVRRRALAEYKSINDLCLHLHFPSLTAAESLTELARMNVSRESLDRIGKVAAILPPDSPVNALVLAIGRETFQDSESDGVEVLTGHSAKGREFKAVWCPCWEQEVLPSTRKDVSTEEERRLAFVMITRAADRLWVSWAKRRAQQWGGPKNCTASQFVAEIQ